MTASPLPGTEGHRHASGSSPDDVAWHALTGDDIMRRLDVGIGGLTPGEAARRLAEHGPNRLPAVHGRSALRRFLAQFENLLIYILVAAGLVTALLGHLVDSAVITGVVVINATVGFIQEGRAEQALDAIRDMLTPHASVLRDGRRLTVDAADLVPGDLVLLEAGDKVPADLRLTHPRGLRIEEAALTGESVPAEKSAEPVGATAPLGDRACMAFSGTLVTAGQSLGVVVATGAATELGRISAMLGGVQRVMTPLLHQMDVFARQLTFVILAVAAAVFAFAWLGRAYDAEHAFLVVVGIAVAAIPEGLPAVLTITLAMGVRRMAARHAIVRQLPAVETLGAVSVICSDKTGTLTRNEMTVATVQTTLGRFEASGPGYAPEGAVLQAGEEPSEQATRLLAELARAAALCNDAALREETGGIWIVDGDPMEGALLAFADRAGEPHEALRLRYPRHDDIPFDSRHRYMATLHAGHGHSFVCVKGAPERLVEMCAWHRAAAGDVPIHAADWNARAEALAAAGMRVIAVATRELPHAVETLSSAEVERDLVLLGLLALIDPPREEAIAAVAECQAAGIRVKMITGDHAATAGAIARQVGLRGAGMVVTGRDLDTLDDATLHLRARESDVFARTSPEHKLRLVQALQAEGAVVAMTGDGVNDAPALKRADVGVAMGHKGTEAAKEAAEIVLADDNFATIVAAVHEGRTVYENVQKVIAWTLPTNGGEALTVIVAILLGVTLPLTPVQILWINMVTAVTLGLVLAFEPAEPDIMRRPPRAPSEPLLSRHLAWRVTLVSTLFMLAAFAIFEWSERRGLSLEASRTAVVNAIVVLEIAYLFSVRFQRRTSFTWRGAMGTPAVLIGVGAVAALQLAFTYAPPLQALFSTRPLDPISDGLPILGVGISLMLVLEGEKHIRRRVTGDAGP